MKTRNIHHNELQKQLKNDFLSEYDENELLESKCAYLNCCNDTKIREKIKKKGKMRL